MCLVCGLNCRSKILSDAPPGAPAPPSKILCTKCGSHAHAKYRKDSLWFSLFFIPLIPVKSYPPYMVCSSCRRALDSIGGAIACGNCGTTASSLYTYCPECGGQLGDGERM